MSEGGLPLPALAAGGVVAAGLAYYYRPGDKVPAMFSDEKSPGDEHHTGIRVHPAATQQLVTGPTTGEKNLYDVFQSAVRNYGNRPCFGFRPIAADGSAGDFEWETYNQINQRVTQFGIGLTELGLIPEVEGSDATGPLKMLALFARNCKEWVISEYACYSQGATTVPLYDTLGPDTVEMVINETLLTTVLAERNELDKLVETAKHCPTLRNVILTDAATEQDKAKMESCKLRCFGFNEVEAAGKGKELKAPKLSPDTICTFCYTSGTTGKSKGALLTHGGLVADMSSIEYTGFSFQPEDVHLSYLPLAHAFERIVQICCIYKGARIGFFQGDTLKIMEDIAAIRPTIFPSVPRLLNRVYDKVTLGVQQKGGVAAKLFAMAYSAKQEGLKRGFLTHALWDKLVFSKLATRVGLDRVRIIITGSAPIAGHVLEFLRIAFRCPVLEGYGQTETCAGATVTYGTDYTVGHVGGPLPCNEIRLESCPELGYMSTDTFHGRDMAAGSEGIPCLGRGEICFRGPNMFKGYYKMPDKTAEAIDKEGWVHSGDIGIWTARGQIKIVDRKKNIFKLAQGEYIAPEKIENVYIKSPFVAQAFVYGDSLKASLVAIIVPDVDYLKTWGPGAGVNGSFEEMCKNPALEKAIIADLARVKDEVGLKSFEHVRKISVESVPFTPDKPLELLTPTFKLKRNEATAHYRATIDKMYVGLQ